MHILYLVMCKYIVRMPCKFVCVCVRVRWTYDGLSILKCENIFHYTQFEIDQTPYSFNRIFEIKFSQLATSMFSVTVRRFIHFILDPLHPISSGVEAPNPHNCVSTGKSSNLSFIKWIPFKSINIVFYHE